MTDQRDRPERTKAALEAAEELIAKWDQDGGMTYRQLAARLYLIFSDEEVPEVSD